MDEQAAARMGDEIAHGFGLLAMVAGAVAGAIVGAAIIGATVATGGAALAIMTGAIAAGGLGLGQLVKGLTKVFNLPEPASGVLARGSPDIIIDYREAMRVDDLAVACSGLPVNHFPLMAVSVAEGSATVFFNGKPAARVGGKMVCGAHIKSGSSTVVIGGPSVRTKFVWDVEQWTEWTLIGLGIFSLGVMGRAAWIKDGIVGVAKLTGFAGGGLLGFEGLGQLGDRLGPGYRDILQGVAGLALLGLGPKLAGKNSAGAAVSEDMQSAKNRPVLAEESSKPWYDMVLDSQKSEIPGGTGSVKAPVLQDEFGFPWVAEGEFRPPVSSDANTVGNLGMSRVQTAASRRAEVLKALSEKRIDEINTTPKTEFPNNRRPVKTSAAIDRTTGKVYQDDSGYPLPTRDEIHPELLDRIPNPSLEPMHSPENCAEFKAANKAMNDGANIENLDLYTINRSKKPVDRCLNCRVTTKGANAISDGLTTTD